MPTKGYFSPERDSVYRISVLKKQYWGAFGWTIYSLIVMVINLHAYVINDNLWNLLFTFIGVGYVYYFGNKSDNLFRARLAEEEKLEAYQKEA